MQVHAAQIQMRPWPGSKGARFFYQQAEFGIGAAGGNLVLRIRIDGGVEAQHNLLAHAGTGCELLNALQLLGGFHIQPANAGLQRLLQFGVCFADAGKCNIVRGCARPQCAMQFAATHHIKAEALRMQQRK